MTTKTTQKVSRGTDDPFYQLMQVSGSSVLKLFGLSQEEATVKQAFPEERQAAALNVLGLFVLHQFRHITVEEVLTMLEFDWLETRAGQQTFEKGRQTGLLDGLQQGVQQGMQQGMQQGELKNAREMLLEALAERFDLLTEAWAQQIQAIDQVVILKHLFRQLWRCQTVAEFEAALAQVGGTGNGALASVG